MAKTQNILVWKTSFSDSHYQHMHFSCLVLKCCFGYLLELYWHYGTQNTHYTFGYLFHIIDWFMWNRNCTCTDVCGVIDMFESLMFCYSPQNGLATKVEKSRKQMKERKNRAKKIRGVKKVSTKYQPSILSIYVNNIAIVFR